MMFYERRISPRGRWGEWFAESKPRGFAQGTMAKGNYLDDEALGIKVFLVRGLAQSISSARREKVFDATNVAM
jgi:hypothetical protein